MTALLPRWAVYVAMGNFRIDELKVYASVVCGGLVGAFLGIRAKCKSQANLKRALSGLVMLGAILMFVSGFSKQQQSSTVAAKDVPPAP